MEVSVSVEVGISTGEQFEKSYSVEDGSLDGLLLGLDRIKGDLKEVFARAQAQQDEQPPIKKSKHQ
jgi:hypothetical protein